MKKIALIFCILFAFYGIVQAQSKQVCNVAEKLLGSWVVTDMDMDYTGLSEEEIEEAELMKEEEVDEIIGKVKFIFEANGVMRGEAAFDETTEYAAGIWKISSDCKYIFLVMDDEKDEEEMLEIVSIDAKKCVLKSKVDEEEGAFSLILTKD